MKKIMFTALAIISVTVLGGTNADAINTSANGSSSTSNTNSTVGNGDITTKSYEVSNFSSVDVANSINVIASTQFEKSVKVYADSNIQDKILVTVANGNLSIKTKGSINPSKPITVTIPYEENQINKVSVKSSATIEFKTPLVNTDLYLSSMSSGKIIISSLNVSNELNINSNSSSTISVLNKSFAKQSTLYSKASSTIGAFLVTSDYVDANALSSGVIKTTVNKELAAKASSSGKIIYDGEGKVTNYKLKSSGTLTKRN